MNPKEGIRRRKVRKAVEYLQGELLKLPCGARLPGIRTIMRQTGTGQITVSHALDILKNEGVIRIDRDRGIYRIKPEENRNEIRLLNWQGLDSDGDPSFFGILYRKLKELAAESGWKITVENAKGRLPEELTERGAELLFSNYPCGTLEETIVTRPYETRVYLYRDRKEPVQI